MSMIIVTYASVLKRLHIIHPDVPEHNLKGPTNDLLVTVILCSLSRDIKLVRIM